MADDSAEKVQLYVYDLSNGLARQLSQALLGKQINGVWHTSVSVGGREWYYGGGIQEALAGTSPFGTPQEIVDLGETHVPDDLRREFIDGLRSKYSQLSYDLFNNNCNNFSDEVAQFLTGNSIPSHITSLPREVLATPFGQMLAPMLSRTIGDTLGHVQQSQQQQVPRTAAMPSLPARPSAPASVPQTPEVSGVADAIKNAAAVAAADTGIPVDAAHSASAPIKPTSVPSAGQSQGALAQEGIQKLSDAHASLSSDPTRAASLAQADSLGTSPSSKSFPIPSSIPDPSPAGRRDKKAEFNELVRAEFGELMAKGGISANEAAALAVRKAASLQA